MTKTTLTIITKMNSFIRTYRTFSKEKANLELPLELREVIIGTMLGDLSAEKRNINSNTRLQFKQSMINEAYILHLYSLFKDFCGTGPKILSRFDSRPTKNKEYASIKFQTLSLPIFNEFREIFYVFDQNHKKEIKKIPLNLEDLLTERSLAY